MKLFVVSTLLFFLLCPDSFTTAAETAGTRDVPPGYDLADGRYERVLTGGVVKAGKARVDTVYLMGGDADPNYGDFEDEQGAPSWDGWLGIDHTAAADTFWNVSDYFAANLDPGTVPNHAWWCGDDIPSCGGGDPDGGYGNNWDQRLDWRGTVPDNTVNTTVTVEAVINYDSEPGYDYLNLQYEDALDLQNFVIYNGQADAVIVSVSTVLTPADYVGDGHDEVHLRWMFTSDGAWSDEDCMHPTHGAAQIDLISVHFDQGAGPVLQGTVEDCDDNPLQWYPTLPIGVGMFAHIWPELNALDLCRQNHTPVLGFIDDGLVVPGTGGYLCTTWCYGYGGYIVNPEGGLAGPDFHIQCEVWSPILAWPGEEHDGAIFAFDVYQHENLGPNSPGMFYTWGVTSTTDPTGQDGWSNWQDRNFVYYGGPGWSRSFNPIADLLLPGRTFVRASVGVWELGWVWGWIGTDGTPAPYFDNIAFVAYEFAGPGMSTREIDIAQDNFPEIGTIDYANRTLFDQARNISPPADLRCDPGDSILCDVRPIRAGSVLNDLPKLYYKLDPNPLFDPHRTAGLPLSGWVWGDSTFTATGAWIADRYNFDLPDTGFFFPGDVIHYFIEGQDNQAGDIGTSLLPPDTMGFRDFSPHGDYSSSYTVRALPTVFSQVPGDHPPILLLNDFANRGGENEWYFALANLGYALGTDYDLYYTNGPSSGVGNGIGGRATATQLMGYETVLYTCGNLMAYTLSNGDFQNDPGDDISVLDNWLLQGNKNLLLTGDNLVYDLVTNCGPTGLAFAAGWIGVTLVDWDIRPLIENQSAPSVQALPGNGVFTQVDGWIAYGGCPYFHQFDAVTVTGSATQLAEFLDPNCVGGMYPYAAATDNHDLQYNNDIVYLPYDFSFIYTGGCYGGSTGPLAARTKMLQDILLHFGHIGLAPVVGVTPIDAVLTVSNFPNPFNPRTTIEYNMPRPGHLAIRIFNLQGRLVRTLIDEPVPAGSRTVEWPGDDDQGRAVSSGVYFCETRALGETIVKKMAIVR